MFLYLIWFIICTEVALQNDDVVLFALHMALFFSHYDVVFYVIMAKGVVFLYIDNNCMLCIWHKTQIKIRNQTSLS